MPEPGRREDEQGRGRDAPSPRAISARGWGDVLVRVYRNLAADNVAIVSGGVAFYALLALFPALAALVAVYGLVFDPAAIDRQIEAMSGLLPEQARTIIEGQLTDLAQSSGTALGLSLAISVLIAVWSATKGTKALMQALNIVYDEDETRGFVAQNAVALSLTVGGVLLVVVALALVAVLPGALRLLGLGGGAGMVVSALRWPLLAVVMIGALAVLYRYGPSRRAARWRWVGWGALAATLLWLVVSGLFSFYVANFGSYNETYGSLGAVVVLLMWLYLSAYVVLLGAELNAEAERQTEQDSTVRPDRPVGRRGARVADELGESRRERG